MVLIAEWAYFQVVLTAEFALIIFVFNPFISEFLKWTLPSLIFVVPIISDGSESKNENRMANRVDPDEMAHNKPSHLDLHCLQKYQLWSAGLKV